MALPPHQIPTLPLPSMIQLVSPPLPIPPPMMLQGPSQGPRPGPHPIISEGWPKGGSQPPLSPLLLAPRAVSSEPGEVGFMGPARTNTHARTSNAVR